MRLDVDCVRAVLLALENMLYIDESGTLLQDVTLDELVYAPELAERLEADVVYSVQKLCEAGYIDPLTVSDEDGFSFRFTGTRGITFLGHEFLNKIRDDSIWSKAKAKVLGNVASASLSIIGSVAEELLKQFLLP